MIKAQHNSWALFLFNLYLPRLLRRNFSRIKLINDFPVIDANKSLLLLPNHMSWWDGLFAYWICRQKTAKRIHMMVLEEQLNKLWFFQKIGAFSIDPQNGVASRNSLRYVNQLLTGPQNLVVLFPQGEIQPFGQEPVNLKNGVNMIIKQATDKTNILPVAFKIQYQNEKKPAVFCRFAEKISAPSCTQNDNAWADAFMENISLCDQMALDNTCTEELAL